MSDAFTGRLLTKTTRLTARDRQTSSIHGARESPLLVVTLTRKQGGGDNSPENKEVVTLTRKQGGGDNSHENKEGQRWYKDEPIRRQHAHPVRPHLPKSERLFT